MMTSCKRREWSRVKR